MSLYLLANGPMQTTAAFAGAQTGTAIKTMLQVAINSSANHLARIVEWGISFDGSSAATPIKCELFACTGAATVTAHVASGIQNQLDPNAAAVTDGHPFALSTTTTGYTASGEGTAAAVRNFDLQFIAPTNQYVKQFPLGREPTFRGNATPELVRIRVTAGADRLCYCYVVVEV